MTRAINGLSPSTLFPAVHKVPQGLTTREKIENVHDRINLLNVSISHFHRDFFTMSNRTSENCAINQLKKKLRWKNPITSQIFHRFSSFFNFYRREFKTKKSIFNCWPTSKTLANMNKTFFLMRNKHTKNIFALHNPKNEPQLIASIWYWRKIWAEIGWPNAER